jgi:pimeloyl-ACP methyl ester carboxylesterase
MVSQQQSESLALEWMQGEAQKQHRTNATAELGNVKIPFETAEHLYLHRKWLALLSGRKAPERAFVFRWSEQWLPLFVEASRIDLFSTAPTFRCPIWLIAGTKDFQCHYEITKKYADHLVAPSKEIVLLPGAAHAIPSSHGALLQEHIIRLAQTVMH